MDVSSQGTVDRAVGTVDRAISAVAAKQRGNIMRRQLRELGLSHSAIANRVAAGRLHRVFRGVYSVGRPPGTPEDRASAAVLACGPGAALSHSSAMVLIGLPGTAPRSGWEDDFPAFCAQYGLPAPVMGQPMAGYILDALFPVEKVIVELDSWPFHKGKPSFESDRERDAEMLALEFVTVRITAERLGQRPQQEAERLSAILASRRANHAPNAA